MSAGTKCIITPLIMVFVLLTSVPTFAGQIIYVDDDGPADFNNIQAAINYSSHGDTIIVAEGRYFENINFNGKNITLTSTDPCNPDVVAATIIDSSQNGSVVTIHRSANANCVLNGFTITNGHAEYGGGISYYQPPGPPPPPPPPPATLSEQSSTEIPYETNLTAPKITNCIISNNSAGKGGGMYNIQSGPILNNCSFSNNSATDDGGGIFNDQSSPTLANCTFSGNSARDRGGGMYNFFERSPTLTNCTFNGNSADLGGGMHNMESSPTLKNCIFNWNSAVLGGGISNEGFFMSEMNPILTNCLFSGNYAEYGAGMLNYESSPTLINCIFNKNSAGYYGGGMDNGDSSPSLTNCIFTYNSAAIGGGISNTSSTREGISIFTNCIFSGNLASRRGGAMYNASYPLPQIKSNLTITNCTFTGNLAFGYPQAIAGGMYNDRIDDTIVINCIFWENMSGSSTNESAQIQGMPVIVNYSCIQGWTGALGGTGNMGADPCFMVPGYFEPNCIVKQNHYYNCTYDWIDGDYNLRTGSPCINTGDPNHLLDPNEKDLDKKLRVFGCRIDMGAFEYRHLVPAKVRIVPHTINLANRGKWITAYLQLPENYNCSDTDFCILLLEDKIEPQQLFINEKEQTIIGRFNDEQLHGILKTGEIELKISVQLTDATVFEGTDVIKVIYEGGGRLAKLGKASNPNPADGATDVYIEADLSWTAGFSATSHDVYFGTSSSPPFVCNQTDTSFDPGKMATSTKYFWRIDEVNKWGKIAGDLWSFTTYGPPPPPPPPPTP